MKKMARILSLVLSVIMLCTTFVVASAEEPVTLKVVAIDRSTNLNDVTTYMSQFTTTGEYEFGVYEQMAADLRELGIELEWELVVRDQYSVFLQTALAKGLDADIVQLRYMDTTTRLELAEDGYFLDIMDTLRTYSPDGPALKFFTEGYGSTNYNVQNVNGALYWIGNTTEAVYQGNPQGALKLSFIRKDWLDACGLDVPTNAEEFYQALKAFQEKDVNGTGIADEKIYVDISNFASNPLSVMFGVPANWYPIDLATNKVTSPWYSENIKAYIEFAAKLYAEGLIEATTIATSQLMAENKIGFMCDWYSFNPTVEVAEGLPAPDWIPIQFNATEGVKAFNILQDGVQCNVDCAIAFNGETEHPEKIAAFLDYVCTEYYWELSEYGIEGQTFTKTEDGEYERLLIEGDFTSELMYKSKRAPWAQETLMRFELHVDRQKEVSSLSQAVQDFVFSDRGFGYDTFTLLEPQNRLAVGTLEEIEEISAVKTDLETYMGELASKLIMGEQSLDNWDQYMADLDRLGLNKLIEIYQAQYDRALTAAQ